MLCSNCTHDAQIRKYLGLQYGGGNPTRDATKYGDCEGDGILSDIYQNVN